MFQHIINILYRHPKSTLQTWKKFGGYFAYKKMFAAEKQMKKRAKKIQVKAPAVNTSETITISFLTGEKYWHQTIFCAYSLQKVCNKSIHFNFYDDGSFNVKLITEYKKQIPNSTFITLDEIDKRLKKALPKEKFPYLNQKREVYKHIRKLTDIHAGNSGWQLVLDSDMLFWKEPKQILEWLENPIQPLYLKDISNAYGFPIAMMEELTQAKIPERVNVGIIGLNSTDINFENLELWASSLEKNAGNSYYLEQALTAMLIGEKPSIIAKDDDYIVYPNNFQINNCEGILHHYVDQSKQLYLIEAWKKIL